MKEKYIVLDLDSTLVTSDENHEVFNQILENRKNDEYLLHDRVHNFYYAENSTSIPMWTLLRPYIREFINFCLKYFTGVIIWSAGKSFYVHTIKSILFNNHLYQPIMVLTWDDTTFLKRGSTHIINKPLAKIFEHIPTANYTNTLVVDDRIDTFSLNQYNGILIPRFEPRDIEEMTKDDTSLLLLMGWLCTREVLNCEDFRTLDKTSIFNKNVEDYYTTIIN